MTIKLTTPANVVFSHLYSIPGTDFCTSLSHQFYFGLEQHDLQVLHAFLHDDTLDCRALTVSKVSEPEHFTSIFHRDGDGWYTLTGEGDGPKKFMEDGDLTVERLKAVLLDMIGAVYSMED